MKTFLATAALATSAFFVGFHTPEVSEIAGKTVTEIRLELSAVSEYWTLNPERAFWACYDANRWNISVCKPYADAWRARDGDGVIVKAMNGIVLHGLANHL